jgi:hypothetical protein
LRPFLNHHPFVVLATWVVCLHGCGPALIPFDEHVPAQVLSYIGAPPIADARARFRAIFCELFNRHRQHLGLTGGCDDCLWRLIDEPRTPAAHPNLPEYDPDLQILIVPGAFSDCFGEIGNPYGEAAERLRQMGVPIHRVNVGGLSSSPENAGVIADAVANQTLEPSQRLVLLGYSKGTTDILHFLVAYPELAPRVSAVLSVSGAVNGSPLADRYADAEYDNWLVGLFPGGCPAGDRGVLDSLSRTQQFRWLASHPLPEDVRYYSLASFAGYPDMQIHLRPTYRLLERIHPLNDGQLLVVDQLIPGSTLMGYVNADHWTVAIPVEETFSNRDPARKDRNRKLRDLLFEAMVLFLAEELNSP